MMKRVAKMLSTCDLNEELRSFSSKMEYLSAQQLDVLKAVEHAEIQPGKKRKSEVELWCTEVEEKKKKRQDIDSEFKNQGPSSALKHQLAKEIKEVEGLIHQGKFPSGVVLDSHSATRLEMVVNTLVGSRSAENIEMITKLLKQDDVFAIGVFGMGGVGKTTLLKKIHNSLLSDSDIEGQVYWVTASRECNLQILQTAIGKCLGLDISKEDDVERRRSEIFRRLSQLKKSVLIIDDMWNHFLTDQVGIPLNSCGCKVVITTRSEEVCRKMGCQKVVKVSPLPEDDAWVLFVEKSGEVADNLYSTAKEIVKECGGLPLALNTMGCCMREVTDVQQWKNALYELQKPARRQDNDMDDQVFRVLQYSYDSLRDERLKQCFLSCVLFPEDWVIGRAELIDLWIMEGLLDDIESWENKENKGHTIVNNLQKSSLLESGSNSIVFVRMHDLVRDMAMIVTQHHPHFMAKAGLQLQTVPVDELWTRDLVKVSLRHNYIKEIPLGMSPETSNLRVLILADNPLQEIPDSFFVHMKALEVLDLSITETEWLEPEGMERLKCLQKLSHCRWRLSNLSRFNSFIQSCRLYSYSIWLYDIRHEALFRDDAYEFWFLYMNEKRVIISGVKFGQTEITPVLPCNIQALYVHACTMEGQRSLGEALPSLRDAKSLSRLRISDCVGLKYVSSAPRCISSVSSYLDNLEVLNLIDLPDLKSIAENGSFSSFSHLRELKISKCPKLKAVLPSMLSQQQICLPHLNRIRVEHCEELEEIFESNWKFLSAQQNLNPCVALPKLFSLDLEGLPKLRNIYSIQPLSTSLQHLRIWDCPKLEGIFTSCTAATKPILTLPKLQRFCLKRLPNLSSVYRGLLIFPSSDSLNLRAFECPKLKMMPLLSYQLICDPSQSTLASLPTESESPEWWEPLHQDFPDDVTRLSDYILQARQRVSWLSLSTS
ncbi:putative disease resistance protein At1g61300 isoform X2 [Silene latifolia]|uniref:putative disease resistance protein At1g61300 isoform X2 n=1 Tax=Silene latifolia TaxID=37657 RepID=UPI003D789C75